MTQSRISKITLVVVLYAVSGHCSGTLTPDQYKLSRTSRFYSPYTIGYSSLENVDDVYYDSLKSSPHEFPTHECSTQEFSDDPFVNDSALDDQVLEEYLSHHPVDRVIDEDRDERMQKYLAGIIKNTSTQTDNLVKVDSGVQTEPVETDPVETDPVETDSCCICDIIAKLLGG